MHVCERGWVCVRHRKVEIVFKCTSEVECICGGVLDRRDPKGMKSWEVQWGSERGKGKHFSMTERVPCRRAQRCLTHAHRLVDNL